jgi:hypothetical protein
LGRTDFAVVDPHYGRHIPDPYQVFGLLFALFGNSGRPVELRRQRDIKRSAGNFLPSKAAYI